MPKILARSDAKRGIMVPSMSPELAYLLGVFAGDGNITIREEKHDYAITCSGHPEDEYDFYVKIIQPLFKKVFGVLPKLQYFKKRGTFGFRISSKTIVNFLVKQGLPVGKKYDSLHIPEALYEEEKFLLAFVRGLFDTDGCMCFKKKYHNYPYYPVISFFIKIFFFYKGDRKVS